MIEKILICLIAGVGAGFGTGLAGLSAAAVISPMLITFLGVNLYYFSYHNESSVLNISLT